MITEGPTNTLYFWINKEYELLVDCRTKLPSRIERLHLHRFMARTLCFINPLLWFIFIYNLFFILRLVTNMNKISIFDNLSRIRFPLTICFNFSNSFLSNTFYYWVSEEYPEEAIELVDWAVDFPILPWALNFIVREVWKTLLFFFISIPVEFADKYSLWAKLDDWFEVKIHIEKDS